MLRILRIFIVFRNENVKLTQVIAIFKLENFMNFEFIEIKPIKTRGNKKRLMGAVRVSFTKPKNKNSINDVYNLTIYIGKTIADELKLKAGDRVSIAYGKENQRIWLVKKAMDRGYKLTDIKVKNDETSSALKFQLTWKVFTPQENEMKMREVEYDKRSESELIIKSDSLK